MTKRVRTVAVTTIALERSLPSGQVTLGPVVEDHLVAHGDEDDVRAELRLFLADHLARLTPAQAARYFLPDGVEVVAVDVDLDPGAQVRPRPPRTVTVACVVVPHGADGRERWGFVPGLDASFHVGRREELAEVAAAEIARVARARGLDGQAWRRLLPALETRVVPIEVSVGLEAEAGASSHRVAEEERRQARDRLDQLGQRLADRLRGGGVALTGRDRELASLTALLEGRERLAVLVCGEEAVGKTALIEAWGRARPQRPAWVTSVAQLVAGASGFGQAEARVQELFRAAERLDAVLYFDDFGSLFRERPGDGGVDVAGVVRRFVVEGRVRVVAEIAPLALDRAERGDVGLIGSMTRLVLDPMDPAQTRAVVAAHVEHWHRAESHRPRVAAATVPVVVELARRYLPYRVFPGKAVRLLDELRSARDGVTGGDGRPIELGPEDAYDGFSLTSGIPPFLLRDDREVRVDDLIARLRTRMIGQEPAVRRVAETLCTVKAQLQPADKPLATFLFVGPTGVGKTELARSLAHLLFAGEERLVRFDMSEYADPWAAERLIRGSEAGDGLLTARVREQPFSVVLLDEIEKAHPAVHDLLLQVAGEGRLTDARGRTSYFHNTIIILTSNLGAHHGGGGGLGLRPLDDGAGGRSAELGRYRAAVESAFRPEMLNRLDAIIAFHRLDRAEVAAVARLQVARLAERRGLVQARVGLDVGEEALAALAAGGYSATYGVRALRRHLDERVVVPAARLLARAGVDGHGGLLVVRADGEPTGDHVPDGGHLATLAAPPVTDVPDVRVSLYRRGGQAGRRSAHGALAVAELRRAADAWMRRELAVEVREQVRWLEAQLAASETRKGKRKARKQALSSEQRRQLATELHRLSNAWQRAEEARGEITAAEDLALDAALGGGDVAEVVAMAEPLVRRFHHAMFWLAVARLEQRDAITLALSAPEVAAPLVRWTRALLADAPRRGWTVTGHLLGAHDSGGGWPAERVWGPPRRADWLDERLEREGARLLLLRVDGAGAACLLGLEACAHRFVGIAKQSPCHLVVSRVALATTFDDAQWLQVGALATPARAPRGPVPRHHPSEDHVEVLGRRVDVPWAEHMARLEEVGLAAIEHALGADEAVTDLYPVALVEPDDGAGEGGAA